MDLLAIEQAHDTFQEAAKQLEPLDITPVQVLALNQLSALPTCTAGALAKQLKVTPAVITGLVDRLERQGWVERRMADRDDRRKIGIVITTDGGRTLNEAAARLAAIG